MSHRCLLITGISPPAGGAGAVRVAKLCKYLPRHGWQLEVVAPAGGGGWVKDESLLPELDGCTVTRVPVPGGEVRWFGAWRARAKDGGQPDTSTPILSALLRAARTVRNGLAVPDEHVLSIPFFLRAAMARARDAGSQVVLTSSPPASSHLVGLLLKSMTGLPWVAELRDPWVGNPFRGEPGVLHRRVDSWLEGQVIAAADAVSVVSPGMQHQLVARYGQSLRRRCHVVTNGFDPDDFEAPAVASGIGPYELLYTGSLASGLTPPDSILAAMTALAERHPDSASRLRLRIVGSTDLETTRTLRTFVARHHAPAVVVDAPVPHHEATRMMRRAHALLLLLAENTPWVLTSKVFEYLGSGTPILAVVPDGDCRELLDRCGGNVVCAPADVDGIVDQLRALAAGEPLSVGRGRRPDEIASFAWPAVAGRLAAILSAVSGP